jgi:hypothetical protein
MAAAANDLGLVPLTREQLRILRELRDYGKRKADVYNEDEVDGLFRVRPRLVQLVKGHTDAVIEISAAGLTRLAAERN